MSGVLKAVGKAFKAVTKVVKKIALPALAIGAVVLTGGAALGVLPSIGALGSSLGLSAGLTSILSTAASGATFGFVGGLLSGKNPIKAATKGFIVGGIAGGIGSAFGAAGGTAANAAQQGSQAATSAGAAASPTAAISGGAQAYNVNQAMAGLGGGIGSAASPAVAAITPAAAQAVAAAPTVAQVASSAGSGGLLGFLNQNPMLASGLIQGIGSGLAASEQAKQAQKDRAAIAANYGDMSGLFQLPEGYAPTGQNAAEKYDAAVYGKVKYDPTTGRVVAGA